jgi:hypothetical protein
MRALCRLRAVPGALQGCIHDRVQGSERAQRCALQVDLRQAGVRSQVSCEHQHASLVAHVDAHFAHAQRRKHALIAQQSVRPGDTLALHVGSK